MSAVAAFANANVSTKMLFDDIRRNWTDCKINARGQQDGIARLPFRKVADWCKDSDLCEMYDFGEESYKSWANGTRAGDARLLSNLDAFIEAHHHLTDKGVRLAARNLAKDTQAAVVNASPAETSPVAVPVSLTPAPMPPRRLRPRSR